MALGEGYLPPVVAQVTADISELIAKLEEAKALLDEYADQTYSAELDVSDGDGLVKLAEFRMEADAIAAKPIVFTVEVQGMPAALASLAALRELNGLAGGNILAAAAATAASGGGGGSGGSPATTALDDAALIKAITAKNASFWAYGGMGAAQGGRIRGGNSGGIGGSAADAYAEAFTLAGSGGGGSGGGGGGGSKAADSLALADILGIGAGHWFPGIPRPAGFGTLAGMAGFGAEHFIGTGLAIGGTAVGGIAGGGLLALGSLGKAGVGMGSDSAVMGSTIGDTKNYSAALAQLNEAIAVYGAGSTEAAAAQYNLTASLGYVTPAAATAEKSLSAMASQLGGPIFDQATSGARIAAVNIMKQVVGLGDEYAPLVGAAAQKNLSIINTGLKPLFSWLGGPQGMGIFNQLEDEFAKELPTAISALTNGIELLLRTMGFASQSTGGFMSKLNDFLIKYNTYDWGKWETGVTHMIGYFHEWTALLGIAAKDIVGLFKNDVGTGSNIVTTLTEMLKKLHDWEYSTEGTSQVKNLFEVHKEELLEILQLLPVFLSNVTKIYLEIAPDLAQIVGIIAQIVNWLLHIPGVGPLLAWAVAAIYLYQKLQLLAFITKVWEIMGAAIGVVTTALAVFGGALGAVTLDTEAADAALVVNEATLTEVTLAEYLAASGAETLGAALAVIMSPAVLVAAAIAGLVVVLLNLGNIVNAVKGFFDSLVPSLQSSATGTQAAQAIIAASTAAAQQTISSALKDTSSSVYQSLAQSATGAQTMSTSLTNLANASAKNLAGLNEDIAKFGSNAMNLTGIPTLIKGLDIPQGVTKNWNTFSSTTQALFNTFASSNDSADITSLYDSIESGGPGAILWITKMALAYGGVYLQIEKVLDASQATQQATELTNAAGLIQSRNSYYEEQLSNPGETKAQATAATLQVFPASQMAQATDLINSFAAANGKSSAAETDIINQNPAYLNTQTKTAQAAIQTAENTKELAAALQLAKDKADGVGGAAGLAAATTIKKMGDNASPSALAAGKLAVGLADILHNASQLPGNPVAAWLKGIEDQATDTNKPLQPLQGILGNIVTTIESLPKNPVTVKFNVFESVMQGISSITSGMSQSASGLITKHAFGGPVTAGGTYVVGEGGGPEVLHMFAGGGGYVTPYAGGNGTGTNSSSNVSIAVPVNVTVTGGATPQTAQQIGQVVAQVVRQQMGQIVRQLNTGSYMGTPGS